MTGTLPQGFRPWAHLLLQLLLSLQLGLLGGLCCLLAGLSSSLGSCKLLAQLVSCSSLLLQGPVQLLPLCRFFCLALPVSKWLTEYLLRRL